MRYKATSQLHTSTPDGKSRIKIEGDAIFDGDEIHKADLASFKACGAIVAFDPTATEDASDLGGFDASALDEVAPAAPADGEPDTRTPAEKRKATMAAKAAASSK